MILRQERLTFAYILQIYKLNTPQPPTASGAAMTRWMYIIAVVLTIGWAVGFFVFHMGNAVHVLILLAITALLSNIIRDGT